MSDSKTITALEIGTGKMQVFIGEVVDDKLLNFIGSGQAATEGVKKADIVDIRRAASQAQAAIVMAERSASAQIKSVCLGISGTHIKGFRNVGSANVSGADGVVRREDVERAKAQETCACATTFPKRNGPCSEPAACLTPCVPVAPENKEYPGPSRLCEHHKTASKESSCWTASEPMPSLWA